MKRINITCPACGSRAYLRPASVVYGDKAPDPETKSQGLFHQIQKEVTFCGLPHGADA